MSAEYPCIYFEKDGKCRKFSDDTYISYCVMGPCSEQFGFLLSAHELETGSTVNDIDYQ